ncbi:hypothetical protein ACQ4PT_018919 [Festuca glaucescens]
MGAATSPVCILRAHGTHKNGTATTRSRQESSLKERTSDGRRATAPPHAHQKTDGKHLGILRDGSTRFCRGASVRERGRNTYPPTAREAAETGRDFPSSSSSPPTAPGPLLIHPHPGSADMGANGTLSEAAVAAAEEERPEGVGGEAMMFRGSNYSLPRTIAALALWLGGIHFNVILILASLFLFPLRLAALVVALQLVFMVIPLNDEDKWGRKIGRFICRYAMGYFPISLHVEDFKAFDPTRAYVFGYEPHSVLPSVVQLSPIMSGLCLCPNSKSSPAVRCSTPHS